MLIFTYAILLLYETQSWVFRFNLKTEEKGTWSVATVLKSASLPAPCSVPGGLDLFPEQVQHPDADMC